MPGYSFQTNPDGTIKTVVNGQVYKGEEPSTSVVPQGGGGFNPLTNNVFTNPVMGPLMGLNPVVQIPAAALNAYSSLDAARAELLKSGNIGLAAQAGQRRYISGLEASPVLGMQRVVYNATTGLATDVSNLTQSANRRPGQAASPLFGLVPPPPKAKSTGGVEDFVTDLVKGALVFIPAEAAIGAGLAAAGGTALVRGLASLPGLSRGVAAVQAVRNVPAAMRTAAVATEGIGGAAGALRVGAKALEVGGRAATQGVAAGAITDITMTPGERTTASQLLDMTQQNKQAADVLKWVDSATGSVLHEPLQRLVLSSPDDTEAVARFKNAVAGLPLGAGVGATLETAGLAARAIFQRTQLTGRIGSWADRAAAEAAAAPTAPRPQPTPAAERVIDVKATPVTQTTGEPPLPPRAIIDVPWNQGGGIQRNLQPVPGAGAMPAAAPPARTTEQVFADMEALRQQAIQDLQTADQQVVRAADEFTTQSARVANTVPDEMGTIATDLRGAWMPSYSQVREVNPAEVGADPVRLQFKAEGQLNKTGVSGSLKEAEYYNPLFGKIISVWRDPADGKLLVVNGHNRLNLAKRSGTEKILVWEIEAKTAEEARAIGAMENIAEGKGTAWDAGKILRDTGMSVEELLARGIDVKDALASQGIALRNLPDNVFSKGVTGELSLEKALALGSEPLDPAVIRDVYTRATKGKWSAAKITQAVQEAKFADVRVEDGGTLPGMGEWFKTTNFNELLDVRTEAFAQLRKEVTALTAAADPARTGYLEGAGNVIDVAGSRAQRERAKAAADLFNRIASSEGPVRDLLKEMAALVGKQRSAGQLVQEYLPRLRDAIEADVRGPKLPLPNAPGAPRPMAEALRPPAAIDPEVLPPEKPATPIADALRDTLRKMAESDARMFRNVDGLIRVAQEAIDIASSGLPASQFAFPPDLAKSKPKFGMATVEFGNDFDRAAYVLRDAAKKSKGEDRLIAALEEAGFDIAEVRKHGQAVNDALKAKVKEQTGSARAPQETMQLDIPAQDFAAAPVAVAPTAPSLFESQPTAGQTMEALATGFMEGPRRQMFEAYQAGKTVIAGIEDPYLKFLKNAKEQGGPVAKTQEEFNALLDAAIKKRDQQIAARQAAPAPEITRVPVVDQATLDMAQPTLLTQDIVIPEKAMRPLDPGSSRVQTVSQSISRWLGIGQDEARNLLLAKGQVLDVDQISGMNLDKALNDAAMGMTTPETQAIARAYEQFYGPSSKQQNLELQSIGELASEYIPDKKIEELKVDPKVVRQVKKVMVETVRKIAGDDIAIQFNDGIVRGMGTRAHGMEGKVVTKRGRYQVNAEDIVIDGDPIKELITFNGMGLKDYPAQSLEEYVSGKLMTAAHEAFHAVQHRYLSSKEIAVLDSTIARIKLSQAKMARAKETVEKSAQAFGSYYFGQEVNMDRTLAMLGVDLNDISEFKAMMQSPSGLERLVGQFGNGIFESIKIVDKLLTFVEKAWNAIRWRGWTSINDVFAQAAAGDLKATGKHHGHVFDFEDLPGKVSDYVNGTAGTSDEWARRVKALDKIGSPYGEPLKLVGQIEGLMSETADVPPRGIPGIPGVDDPEWQKRWAQLYKQYADQLAAGEITREELYMLNHFEKPESPSGTPYTTKSEELLPGLAAMSQVLPDRPTESGIPVMSTEATVKSIQDWFDRHGEDRVKILAGLDALTKGFAAHEHGALNRAMAYADKLQVDAQIEAAKWLNSANEGDPAESLARLVAAADKARRMHRAIMQVTRPWGQLGLEMQLPRDYEIPPMRAEAVPIVPAGEAFPAKPEDIQPPSVVDDELGRVLAPDDQRPEAVFEDMTDLIEPELTTALQGGELTPKAQAAADDLATFVVAGGVDPSVRAKVWTQLEDVSRTSPKTVGSRINGNSPLIMLLVNNLISSGVTASSNILNGMFNGARLMGAQGLGSLLHGDMERAMYAGLAFARSISNISTGFRLAGEAIRTGEPLTNMRSVVQENFDQLAAMDAQGELLKSADPTARTGWTITTMDMAEPFANSFTGKVLNALWQIVGTGASRLAIGIDTFNSTMAGHTYEHFRHMPRGMQLAGEKGLEKFSAEAWDYANKYARARVDASLKDAIIKGRTIADAILDSPEAQKFMNAVNFTDDIMVELEPRSLGDGLNLGVARGLKGDELTKFAKQYVDEGNWRHKLASGMMEGFDMSVGPIGLGRTLPFGRLASVPGVAMDLLANAPLLGPVFRMAQPFIRFPANMIKSAMRSTPAAVIVDSAWRDFTSADAATRQRVTGEIAMASGALALGVLATQMGSIRINGAGPQNPLSKENWDRAGRLPYSIQYWDRSTNSWSKSYPLSMAEPYATLFGMIGDYSDLAGNVPIETRNRMAGTMTIATVVMAAQGLLSKTYFQGFNNLYEAAFNPNQTFTGPGSRDPFVRYLARLGASFVPYSSAMRAARRQVDPIARSVDPGDTGSFVTDLWKELIDEIRNQTPGFSEGLPPRRDWTLPGAPPISVPQIAGTEYIPENAPFLAGVMQAAPWSSIRPKEAITDPVQKEMADLYSRGTVFSGPRAADFGQDLRLTSTELSRYQQIFGSIRNPDTGKTWHQTVTDLINDPNYKALPIEPPSKIDVPIRAAWIQREIARFKELAKKEFMASPGKGAQIKQELERRAGRAAREKTLRQYGVPGASDAVNFIQEMNR